jgi:hypothetical protein
MAIIPLPKENAYAALQTDVINLRKIPSELYAQARAAVEAKDAVTLAFLAGNNTRELWVLLDNLALVRTWDTYEEALLEALVGTRTNTRHVPLRLLHVLLKAADRQRLRAAGDPFGKGPFTLYRGVSGYGEARRIRGVFWTGSLDVAWWFARRWNLAYPAVYQLTLPDDQHILAHVADRKEDDYIVLLPEDGAPPNPKRTRLRPQPEP